jgi:hypothetical protein
VEGKHHDAGIRRRKDSQAAWQGLRQAALIDKDDPVHPHGRQARVKSVRLLRRRIRGKPPRKARHLLGAEKVGLDVAPATVAAVGAQDARLALFWQRRANHPDNNHADGRAKPGARPWHRSAGLNRIVL